MGRVPPTLLGTAALLFLSTFAPASVPNGVQRTAFVVGVLLGLIAFVQLVAQARSRRTGAAIETAAEAELVAMIEEGRSLGPDLFRPPDYGPYVLWRDKCSGFIESVFGAVERQRFNEPYDPPPPSLARNLEDHMKRLGDLRDRPHTRTLQVNAEGLSKAAQERRFRSFEERVVDPDYSG